MIPSDDSICKKCEFYVSCYDSEFQWCNKALCNVDAIKECKDANPIK